MELSPTRGQATGPSNSLVQIMRRHPLFFFFLMAYGFSWLVWVPFVLSQSGVGLLPFRLPVLYVVLGAFLGPCLAGFLMTAVTAGKVGMVRLLRRFILWRVGFQWYLFAILGMPALIFLTVLALLPGARLALTLSSVTAALLAYPGNLVLLFLLVGGGEEPGWRGFALPGLQPRYGPLVGSLTLGLLWAGWHLPGFLTINDMGGPGVDLLTDLWHFVLFVPTVVANAIIITWVFNNTRGSMLLAMLTHAGFDVILLPQTVYVFISDPFIHLLVLLLSSGITALLLVVLTRGRLSYQRYQRETGLPVPTGRKQGPGIAGTSL